MGNIDGNQADHSWDPLNLREWREKEKACSSTSTASFPCKEKGLFQKIALTLPADPERDGKLTRETELSALKSW